MATKPERRYGVRRAEPAWRRLLRRRARADSPAGEPAGEALETSAGDPGWTFHETAGDFEGWLYHFADGTMAAEDGTVYEYPSGSAPAEAAAAAAADDPAPPADAGEAGAGEPGTLAEMVSTFTGGRFPDTTPDPTPDPTPDTGAESVPTSSSNAASVEEEGRDRSPGADEPEVGAEVPAYVEYTPTNLFRYVLGAVFVAAAVASVLTLFQAVEASSRDAALLAAALVALATVSWWLLLGWTPTTVSIRGHELEVAKGSRGAVFDLHDPDVDITVGANPGSPTWRTVLRREGERDVVIRADQVKARHFVRIVEHHRSRARGTT